ncbi:phage tail tube protein [Pseudorhizobium tarimense]|nr:phage tail tube protein [Pseudorhizobium tarimense]MCJ8517303.1 phage tail tube protein [Pseudorhizobium tarimense]
MVAQKGKALLLKIGNGPSYVTVAGLRSRRLAFNAETVDVTDAESAERWRELLAVHSSSGTWEIISFAEAEEVAHDRCRLTSTAARIGRKRGRDGGGLRGRFPGGAARRGGGSPWGSPPTSAGAA